MTPPPPERSASRPLRAPLAVAGVLGAALIATGLLAFRLRAATDMPPVYWTLPAFDLVDQHGRRQTPAQLAGAPWIADFIFTRCAGVCPRMTGRLKRLQGQLPAGTRIVSITVDPAHDTPEVLQRYARDYEAGPEWLFLTGDRATLYRLAVDGFKLEAMEVPPDQQQAGGDGPFLHSAKLALVDSRGAVRGYYDSDDEEAVTRLVRHVAALAGERR